MLNFKIKTHNHKRFYNVGHFYILNKGNNAGRPSFEPYRNAFVVFCNNPRELQKLYWMCTILHVAKQFKPYFKGAVIPFITIGDVKRLIKVSCIKYEGNHWEERFKVLKKLEEAEETIRRQSQNLKRYKILMMQSYQTQLD